MIGGVNEVSRYTELAEVRETAMLLLAQLGVWVGVGVAVAVGAAVGGAAHEVEVAQHTRKASSTRGSQLSDRARLRCNM